MQPFKIPASLETVREAYPSALDVARVAAHGGQEARFVLARLWLSEGIPYAFRQRPAVYEAARGWLATRLAVDPKEITVIGSARLGQSLAPGESMGKPFSPDSDLDLTVISSSLFEKLRDAFNTWAYHYETGVASPKNPRERMFWDDNLTRGPKILGRGFIDAKMIPLREGYPVSQAIGQTMFLLREKLKATVEAPQVRGASVRVYRDWNAFVVQIALSLASSLPV